ncbi:hypothetical protein Amal_00488 [Acetobacter malorum]|uniref:Uncharacterized protein n=1 Tax=Acetobacter malorum TaxID=178901 RepID=A0A177GG93_9PROT|nr:hypothetical protein Amal_00488 [Acetobacter malorum]
MHTAQRFWIWQLRPREPQEGKIPHQVLSYPAQRRRGRNKRRVPEDLGYMRNRNEPGKQAEGEAHTPLYTVYRGDCDNSGRNQSVEACHSFSVV